MSNQEQQSSMKNATKQTKFVREPWVDEQHPNVTGWKRSRHIRGPNDKNCGMHYYTYHPPKGKQVRSIKQARIQMDSDMMNQNNANNAKKIKTEPKEETPKPQIVTPSITPNITQNVTHNIIDLTDFADPPPSPPKLIRQVAYIGTPPNSTARSLSFDDIDDESDSPLPLFNGEIYGNITIHQTPGGGIHIRWPDNQ